MAGTSVEGEEQPRARALGRQAARGGVVTLVGQAARLVIQVSSIVVLARLVSPTDYGYVAMVTAIVGFAFIIQDAGLSRAAVQAPAITPGQRDNLFWINVLFGIVAAGLVFAAAPAVGALYGEPNLVEITRWLALLFLLSGFAAQSRSSLQRDLRFGTIAVIDVVGPLLGLVAGIAVAMADGGYWALVTQQLVTHVINVVGSMIAAGWLPGLPKRHESVRSFVAYGAHVLGAETLSYVSMNADSVVVGARFGPSVAGFYDRGFRMMMLPIRQLHYPAGKVALPVLSRLQDDAEQFGRFLVRGQSILLNLLVPMMLLGAAVAGPVIEVLLGPGWADVALLFAVLACGGAFQAALFAVDWAFTATGNTRAQFRFALVSRPAIVAAVLVGSLWGSTGVAAGYGIAVALSWPASLWWVGRATGMSMRPLLANGIRTIAANGIAALAASGVVRLVDPSGPWAAIGLGVLVMSGTILFGALVWPAFQRDLRQAAETRQLLAS